MPLTYKHKAFAGSTRGRTLLLNARANDSLRVRELISTLNAGDNCGTGAGGFKPGNTCAAGSGKSLPSLKKFPTTNNPHKMGFIKPNGVGLDLSDGFDARHLDHHDAFETDTGRGVDDITLRHTLAGGLIRVTASSLEIHKEPTDKQYATIRRFADDSRLTAYGLTVACHRGLEDSMGGWKTFEKGTPGSEIVKHLRAFYAGQKLYQSLAGQFHVHNAGDNCGTGAGGFKPGNTCARKGSFLGWLTKRSQGATTAEIRQLYPRASLARLEESGKIHYADGHWKAGKVPESAPSSSPPPDVKQMTHPIILFGAPDMLSAELIGDFWERHGQEWQAAPLPKGFGRGVPKECHRNATLLVLAHPELDYVEGIVYPARMPVGGIGGFLHSWAVDKEGHVIDNTLVDPENCRYFGVRYPRDKYLAYVMKTKMHGVFGGDETAAERVLKRGKL